MTKMELADKVYAKASLSTKVKAEEAVETILDCIKNALIEGDSVAFTGFGTFKVGRRAERTGRNPKTNEAITIPASNVVKFTVGKSLKEAVN